MMGRFSDEGREGRKLAGASALKRDENGVKGRADAASYFPLPEIVLLMFD